MSAGTSQTTDLIIEEPEAALDPPKVFAPQGPTASSIPRFKTEKRPATYMEAMKKLSEELPYIAYTIIKSELKAPKNPKAATMTVIDTPKHGAISEPRIYYLHDYPSKYHKDALGHVQQSKSEPELPDDTLTNELKEGDVNDILYRVIMVEEINGRAIDLLGKAFPASIDPDLLVEHLALQRHRKQRFERAQKFIPRKKNYISLQWSRVFVHHDGRRTAEHGGEDSSTMALRNTVPRPFSRLWIDGPESTMEGTGNPGDAELEDSTAGDSTAGDSMTRSLLGGNPTMREEPLMTQPGILPSPSQNPSLVSEKPTPGSPTPGGLTPGASTSEASTPGKMVPGGLKARESYFKPGSRDLPVALAEAEKAPTEPAKLREGGQAPSGRGEVHAHYECASICWVKNDNGPTIVLLFLDPLPEPQSSDSDYKIISYDHCRGGWDSKSSNAPELPIGEAEITQLEEDDPEEWEGFQPRAKQTKLDNWQPKNPSNVNLPLPSDKRSTTETLKRDLKSAEVHMKYNNMKLNHASEMVARLLFRIIERDSYMLLTTISEGLHGIQNTMHVSDNIHEHMALWQDLFVKYREHVFCIRRCMSNLMNCLKALDRDYKDIYSLAITRHPGHKSQKIHTSTPIAKDPEFYDDLISLLEQVETVYLEIQETSNSLMSIISIIESERAIDEAEGVSKLTELAFFFIPLGFSSTLFGMQVKEINGNSIVSISTWIITAFCIVFASYALRLAVRSRFVSKTKEYMIADVREGSGLNKKTPIPLLTFIGHQTTKLISWGFPGDSHSAAPQQHTLAGFFMVVCVFILLATALIWIVKSPLPILVKVALTCGFNIPWVFIMCGSTIYKYTKIAGLDSRIQRSTNRRTTGLLGTPRVQTAATFSNEIVPSHAPTWLMGNPKRPILGLSHLLDGGREFKSG